MLFVVQLIVGSNRIQCSSNDFGDFRWGYLRQIRWSISNVRIVFYEVHLCLDGSNELFLLFSEMAKVWQCFAHHVFNTDNWFAFVGTCSWGRLAIPRIQFLNGLK